jgi:hypothetical protein
MVRSQQFFVTACWNAISTESIHNCFTKSKSLWVVQEVDEAEPSEESITPAVHKASVHNDEDLRQLQEAFATLSMIAKASTVPEIIELTSEFSKIIMDTPQSLQAILSWSTVKDNHDVLAQLHEERIAKTGAPLNVAAQTNSDDEKTATAAPPKTTAEGQTCIVSLLCLLRERNIATSEHEETLMKISDAIERSSKRKQASRNLVQKENCQFCS